MLKKQKILLHLQSIYNERSTSGTDYTEIGKSSSVEELHRKTSLSLDNLNLELRSLSYNEYIDQTKLSGKGDTIFWYITDKGRDALSTNEFVWYCKLDNWYKILTVLIAGIALLNSMFGFIWLGDKTLK